MVNASFGSRFIAYLIDEVALSVLAWVILMVEAKSNALTTLSRTIVEEIRRLR